MSRIPQYVTFRDGLFSFRIMLWRLIQVVAGVTVPFIKRKKIKYSQKIPRKYNKRSCISFSHSPPMKGNILNNCIPVSEPLVDPCNPHHNQDTEVFRHPRLTNAVYSHTHTLFPLTPNPWQPISISIFLLFQQHYTI